MVVFLAYHFFVFSDWTENTKCSDVFNLYNNVIVGNGRLNC